MSAIDNHIIELVAVEVADAIRIANGDALVAPYRVGILDLTAYVSEGWGVRERDLETLANVGALVATDVSSAVRVRNIRSAEAPTWWWGREPHIPEEH